MSDVISVNLGDLVDDRDPELLSAVLFELATAAAEVAHSEMDRIAAEASLEAVREGLSVLDHFPALIDAVLRLIELQREGD